MVYWIRNDTYSRELSKKGSAGEHSSKFFSPSTKHYILIFLIPSSQPVLAQNVPGTLTCPLSIKMNYTYFIWQTSVIPRLRTSCVPVIRNDLGGLSTALIRAAHRAEKLQLAGTITDYRYEKWRRIALCPAVRGSSCSHSMVGCVNEYSR
jgi:hypothetical protein